MYFFFSSINNSYASYLSVIGVSVKTCSICVRGGSKGIPQKNIRPIAGKPLLLYTIQQALESHLFDAIAVSSDSTEILDVAQSVPGVMCIERPPELATDQAAKIPAIRHCHLEIEKKLGSQTKIAVDLDATSPLRSIEDIMSSIQMLEQNPDCTNVITGTPSRRSPYFNLVEEDTNGYVKLSKVTNPPIVRRQDAPRCFDMNASIYVWRRDILLNENFVVLPKTKIYEMPEERSFDIDSVLDFKIVEMLLKERGL